MSGYDDWWNSLPPEDMDDMAPYCVYLSGPMVGKPDYNVPLFRTVAQQWRDLGWLPFDPTEIPDTPGVFSTSDHRYDYAAMMRCDAIAMLPGWEECPQCVFEYALAKGGGMAVYDAITRKVLVEPSWNSESVSEE